MAGQSNIQTQKQEENSPFIYSVVMDGSFNRSPWNWNHAPRSRYFSSSNVRDIPVHGQTMPVQKVVTIPVHSVGSDRNRSDSAVKIQKVFRGFLVRKSMKKITAIRREVNEIEKRVLTKETVDLIRRDSKERLKVNEALMSLLFKLDSVRGVVSGVRDCRKAVIKKVIALQEMIDAIVAADEKADAVDGSSEPDNADTVDDYTDRTPEIKDSVENMPADEKDVDRPPDAQHSCPEVGGTAEDSAYFCNSSGNAVDRGMEFQNHGDSMPVSDEFVTMHDSVCMPKAIEAEVLQPEGRDETSKQPEAEHTDMIHECHCQGNMELTENVRDNEVDKEIVEDPYVTASVSECQESVGTNHEESQVDSSTNLIEEDEGNDSLEDQERVMEIHHPGQEEGNTQEPSCDAEKKDENKRSRELLQRMMEDNEKMMELMAELFERNEMQTRLLSSLSQRVERLEKAFICERLRRKKKRNAAGLDCSESTQDNKKFGSDCKRS